MRIFKKNIQVLLLLLFHVIWKFLHIQIIGQMSIIQQKIILKRQSFKRLFFKTRTFTQLQMELVSCIVTIKKLQMAAFQLKTKPKQVHNMSNLDQFKLSKGLQKIFEIYFNYFQSSTFIKYFYTLISHKFDSFQCLCIIFVNKFHVYFIIYLLARNQLRILLMYVLFQ